MDTLHAGPGILKQANLSFIRNVIKTRETATRADIAAETGLSFTTVRSLLTEMIEREEIESVGFCASSGGRKAQRYRLKAGRYYGAAFCIFETAIHSLLIDACGEIVESSFLDVTKTSQKEALFSFLDRLTQTKEIRVIGLGVPGVVENNSYYQLEESFHTLRRIDLGEILFAKYGIPVFLENDINATAIGFDLCYKKEFPSEVCKESTFAYVHFEKKCISAGFLSDGKIIRGHRHLAGELGLIPTVGDLSIDEYINGAKDDLSYVNRIIEVLSFICGILNPQYIALAGPGLRKHCIGPISDGLASLLPGPMLAEILFSDDIWNDYSHGMAHLTAEKIFAQVQFMKK